MSVSHGCIRFTDRYQFPSSSSDSLGETLVDVKHKALKNLKKEIVGDVKMLNIVNELETLISEDRYHNDSLED